MKKAIPTIYYYNTDNIQSVSLDNIEGNAVVILNNKNAYFVKEKQLLSDGDAIKTHEIELDSRKMNILSKKEGKIVFNDIQSEDFKRPIEKLLKHAKFPHAHSVVVLDNNAEITITFSEDEKEDIHPLLLEYYQLQNANPKPAHSSTHLLETLRNIKEDIYCEQSISFLLEGGTKMGFGFTQGTHRDVGIDGMIDSVLQASMPLYKKVFEKIDYISSRFSESILTPMKQNILKDFRLYCGIHADQDKSNADLFKDWLTEYMRKTSQNPIDTLKEHRRTNFTMFNPKETDSIKLLQDFVGTDHNLQDLINTVSDSLPSQGSHQSN